MRIDKLFHVLVVSGAAVTAGLVGCGDEKGEEGNSGGTGSGGSSAGSSASGSGGSSGGSGGSGSGDACEAKCAPNETNASWTDCDGCCCWLPAGSSSPIGPICGEEPCCEGRGR